MRGRRLWYRGIARSCVSAVTTMALVAGLVPARASAMDGAGADVPVVVAGDADSEVSDPIAIDVSDGDGQAADGGLEVVESPDGEAPDLAAIDVPDGDGQAADSGLEVVESPDGGASDEVAAAQAQDGAGDAVEESPVLSAAGTTTSDWDLSRYSTARGSLGFFEYLDAKGAVAELTGQENFDYFGNGKRLMDADSLTVDASTGKPIIESTDLGADGDATSLENTRAAIEWIRAANEYRALWNEYKGYKPGDEGYAAPLRINNLLMAEAQIATNLIADRGTTGHSGYGEGLENVAYTSNENDNPFDGWYDAELTVLEGNPHPVNGWPAETTGHLMNLVNPMATVTGFGVSQNGTGTFDIVYTQQNASRASQRVEISTTERYSAARGETPSYDVEDYYNQFMAYYNAVKAAEAEAAGVPYVPFQTDMAAATVSVSPVTYTGQPREPRPSVTLNGNALFASRDYTVAFANNVNAGTATVTVTGKGSYSGTKTSTFQISPVSIADATVGSVAAQTYTGSAIRPPVVVTRGGATLREGTDYTLSYSNNVSAGTATITIAGKGNYGATKRQTFLIRPTSLEGASVTADKQTHTGGALRPDPVVTLGGKELVLGSDYYAYSYADNVDVGTATVTVMGRGNYTGTASGTFVIEPRPKTDISGATASAPAQTYTGSALKPTPTVRLGSKTLVVGTDYTVAYASNTDAGTATMTVTGAGDYVGTATGGFEIRAASIAGATASASDQTYTGGALSPAVTVRLGSKTLVGGTDFTVSYSNNTNAGTATATVTGKGNYAGTTQCSFKVKAADIASASVSAPDQTYTGSALKPTPTVRLGTKTLASGTDYTVSYSGNTNAGTATVTVTGKGNYAGTATSGFTVRPLSIAGANVTAPGQTYTGSPIRPAVTVTLGGRTLASGTDYTVAYANNTNVGTATATVTGKGNYTGKATGSFSITAKPKVDISGATASASDQTYTGSALTPTVTVRLGTKTLVGGTDYTVAYASNTNAGTASFTVTGRGDYTGSVTGDFGIKAASIASASVTVADQTYTGSALRPAVTVRLGSRTLKHGTDYELAYKNNVGIGTATVTITGRGNFAGTRVATFRIAGSSAGWRRLSGEGRYDTMASIVGEGFGTSDWAVVAFGQNFPDVLAAAPLAGMRDCPVVLTEGGSLSAQARSELGRLGVRHAYVMGGTGVVSGAVEADLEAMGIEVVRVAGSDRQQTSVMALRELAETRPTTVVVATGRNYADTLSIGPWCYREAAPILLTGWDDRLTDEQVAAVRACPSVTGVVIVGGTGAVSADVEKQLAGYSVERLAGSDRYATSALVAEWEIARGMGVSHAAVATGANFPDALAGAALCGRNDSVLLLSLDTDYGTVALRDVLAPHASEVYQGYVLGGEGAVPPKTLDYLSGITQ